MYQYNTDECVICHEDFSHANKVKVSPKGIATILEFSNGFGDLELAASLSTRLAIIFVHGDCRKRFTNKRRFDHLTARTSASVDEDDIEGKNLRTASSSFNFKEHCFFCCKLVDFRKDRFNSRYVLTDATTKTVLNVCFERNDTWACNVLSRLEYCGRDLFASDAVYHKICHTYFTTGTLMPESISINTSSRPSNETMAKVFEEVCDEMEESAEQLFTIAEFHQEMECLAGSDHVYSKTSIKQKLEERYQNMFSLLRYVDGKMSSVLRIWHQP